MVRIKIRTDVLSVLFMVQTVCKGYQQMMNTYFYNNNLIWRTVSHLVDEVIPSDHPEMQSVSSDSVHQINLLINIICL